EVAFYFAGRSGAVLGVLAVLWDNLLGTRELLMQRPVTRGALARSPLLACGVVLTGWMVFVPIVAWLFAAFGSGVYKWSYWAGVPEILTTLTIAWPACAIGCIAASLPVAWWLRGVLLAALTVTCGFLIDTATSHQGETSKTEFVVWTLSFAAVLFPLAAHLGAQRADPDRPLARHTRWVAGLLLLLSVIFSFGLIAGEMQSIALHSVRSQYPRFVELNGQVALALATDDWHRMAICNAEHAATGEFCLRMDVKSVDYQKPGYSVRLEIEAPRFRDTHVRQTRIDYETSIYVDGSGRVWWCHSGDGEVRRIGIGPELQDLPPLAYPLSVADVGDVPNVEVVICGDKQTGRLWRYDQNLGHFVTFALPNDDCFMVFERLRRPAQEAASMPSASLLASVFDRDRDVNYIRGAAGSYLVVSGALVKFDAPTQPTQKPFEYRGVCLGDDPLVFRVDVPARDGVASFHHDFAPRTWSERLHAGHAMLWSLLR